MNDSPIQFGVKRPANDAPGSCATCRFSHRSQGDLLCRRNPPQLSVVLGPAPPPRMDTLMPLPFCGFPPVNDKMWCGEHQTEQARALLDSQRMASAPGFLARDGDK